MRSQTAVGRFAAAIGRCALGFGGFVGGTVMAVLLCGSPVHAASLFSYELTSSGPGAPATVYHEFTSYEDVVEFIDNFDFTAYDAFSTTESITLFGSSGAIRRTDSATGNLTQISSPVTGLVRTFTGPNAEDNADDYVDSDQATKDLIAIVQELTKLSPVTQVDGSPKANTATSSQTVFEQFAFTPLAGQQDFTAADSTGGAPVAGAGAAGGDDGKRGWLGLGIYADQSRFTVDLPGGGGEVDGTDSKVSLPVGFRFSESVSLRMGLMLSYTDIEGTETYGASVYAGVPVKLLRFSEDGRWHWQVTPFAGAGAAGSTDGLVGSATYSFGVTNLVEYKLSTNLIVSFATQISAYESFDALDEQYDFAIPVSQQILKNGVRLRWRAAPRWILEGFVMDTRFLEDAAVESYETVGTGVSFKITKRWYASVNTKYEFGDNFKGWNVGFSSGWNF